MSPITYKYISSNAQSYSKLVKQKNVKCKITKCKCILIFYLNRSLNIILFIHYSI